MRRDRPPVLEGQMASMRRRTRQAYPLRKSCAEEVAEWFVDELDKPGKKAHQLWAEGKVSEDEIISGYETQAAELMKMRDEKLSKN